MDRRDFLRAAGFAGLSLAAPGVARGADPYAGRFFVMVHAGGGWDPTSLCDPKGRLTEDDTDPVNMFMRDDIGTAGNIRYAPIPGNQAFFDKHYQRLLVINGIDTATNGHDSGTRHTWSGRLAEGHPAFAALGAASLGSDRPLAFISNGGYDQTMGLVAPTRTGNTGVMARIAHPNRIDPNDENSGYLSGETFARIRRTQAERSAAKLATERLPVRKTARSELILARSSDNDIKRLTEHLGNLDNSNNRLRRQSQLAIAAYKAGIAVSANLSVGGFDTHGNHDDRQFPRLRELLEGVDFLLEEAERQDVADKVVVMVASDFGRTPSYNAQNGKDHWSITSAMLIGEGIRGDRVVGHTDERHRPIKINAETLAPDPAGVRIEPGHLHRALRDLAGITGGELDRAFPLSVGSLPLLA